VFVSGYDVVFKVAGFAQRRGTLSDLKCCVVCDDACFNCCTHKLIVTYEEAMHRICSRKLQGCVKKVWTKDYEKHQSWFSDPCCH